MSETDQDGKLIKASLDGDMAAFKMLVQKHEGKVAGIVKSMLGDTPEAMDTGQEVFIRFYESMGNFRRNSSLATYLGRIAINLSLNELGRRKKRSQLFESLNAASNVAEESIAEDDNMDPVRREIELLEPEFKAVVTLRMIEGYSTDETATILGVPLGTVLSRLSRAQKKLKSILLNHKKR
jgi:RNA polymerase sigma-70 factor, ECF subfamily